MRILIVATGLTALCSPALAQCPVESDLDKGIRFTVDGSDTEDYRRAGPAMVEATYTAADGYATRNMLAQGVYLVELVDMVDGAPDLDTRATYAFPGRSEDLMQPDPGESVTYDIVVNEAGEFRKERQIYVFDQTAKLNFGACEYEMIPIEIRYEPDDSGAVDLLYYIPELGFSYYAGTDHADGTADRYTYSNIEVIE